MRSASPVPAQRPLQCPRPCRQCFLLVAPCCVRCLSNRVASFRRFCHLSGRHDGPSASRRASHSRLGTSRGHLLFGLIGQRLMTVRIDLSLDSIFYYVEWPSWMRTVDGRCRRTVGAGFDLLVDSAIPPSFRCGRSGGRYVFAAYDAARLIISWPHLSSFVEPGDGWAFSSADCIRWTRTTP